MKSREYIEDLLLRRSIPVTETGCWIWLGAVTLSKPDSKFGGYGYVTIDCKNHRTHRLAWEIWRGRIPEGMFVCHRCDVRECVNPDHLFLGAPVDNVRDMHAKRRHPGAPWAYKVDPDTAAKIRAAKGRSLREIGRRFGVTHGTVQRIKSENPNVRLTREHVRSIRGFRIVNPHGSYAER